MESHKKVKPGMTAEASLTIKDENREAGYVVPIQALLPSPEPNRGYAFVYDPETSTVKKTPVHSRGTADKNVIVGEGLKAGDIIAVAGVSFLADGMEVKLLEGNKK
jgi:multidrug efflux pump subunit AcrA (membrane-fusion protein)